MTNLAHIADQLAELRDMIAQRPAVQPEYMSPEDAAVWAGVSRKTLERAVKAGELVPCRPSRGRVVYSKRDLADWLERSKKKSMRKGRGRHPR